MSFCSLHSLGNGSMMDTVDEDTGEDHSEEENHCFY